MPAVAHAGVRLAHSCPHKNVARTHQPIEDGLAVSGAWPTRLWLVRHGESAGNVARAAAEAAGARTIEIAGRDVDVPLSSLGERQSRAVGAWFQRQPLALRPNVVLSSPYRRAMQTAQLIVERASFEPNVTPVSDERLREKEFGVLDRLTRHGIKLRHPEQAAFRSEVGKFYHRPPGGRW